MHKRPTFFSSTVLCPILVLIALGCKTSPPSAPADTAPTASITSPSANEVCRMTDTVFVDAADDRAVTKVELYIDGSLAGTDQAAPWRFIWNTTQWADGSHSLQAKAFDAAAHSTSSTIVTMTISNAFPVTFYNSVRTAMSVTVLSVTRTIQPGDSSTFTLSANPQSLIFAASTSGKTTGGTVIGLVLSWGGQSNPIDVSNYSSVRLNLQAPSTYFFMYMTNSGKTTLGPIYVNYGLTDQTKDNIAVPGDGATYSIGYYKAYTNTVVRAYWSYPTTSYTGWSGISFPFTANQAINFTNSFPLSQAGIANAGQPESYPGIVQVQPTSAAFVNKAGGALNDNTLTVFANDR